MLDRLGRWRMPAIAVISILLATSVAGAILFLGRIPTALNGTPSPTAPSHMPRPSSAVEETPESALRAFYDALAEARRTDDPSIVEPFVNGTDSSAYLTASGFLLGQREVGKASVITVNEITNVQIEVGEGGDSATLVFDHRLGGYDIDFDTGEPLESPTELPVRRSQATVVLVGERWLVDSFEIVDS